MANSNTKRTRRRIVWGIVAACTVAALLLVLTWAQRPHWRTFTFPADPKTGVAVAIDYPDAWQIGTMFDRPTEFSPMMYIPLAPHPPQGVVRWWMEKVLRQEVIYDDTDGIAVGLRSGSDYKNIPKMEKEFHDFLVSPGSNVKLTHERHALGPALAVSGTVTAPFRGKPRSEPPFRVYGMAIFLPAKDGLSSTDVTIGAMTSARRFPRFAAAMTAMIPRIHLVRTANAVQHH